ncbi:MAG: SCO family protein [Pseudomonadota bacterium]
MKTSTSLNNKAAWPTLAATCLVCILGAAALGQATMGYQLISTEDGRRLDILRTPRRLPSAAIHHPYAATLEHMLDSDGRVAIVTFMYASCNAVCSVLGTEFQQMQAQILARGVERQVRLVSISFDPRDDAATLAAYGQRLHADPSVWQFASIDRASERTALLDAFGIVVLPAPLGEFQHNAAFHLIDRQGRLARIDDYDHPEQALEQALRLARQAAPDRHLASR